MKQITLRDIPEKVEDSIKRVANEKQLSINKAVIALLRKATEEPVKGLHHDLDDLFGAWTAEDEQEFTRNLREQRSIDEALWHTK